MEVKAHPKVDEFINSLEKKTVSKVLGTIELLEDFGYRLTMPHGKQIGSGLYELRVRGQQEIRIFYVFFSGKPYLLHGFVKKTKNTPQREIQIARQRLPS